MAKVLATIHLGADMVVAAELVVAVQAAVVATQAVVDLMEAGAIMPVEEDLSILELIRKTHLVLMIAMVW